MASQFVRIHDQESPVAAVSAAADDNPISAANGDNAIAPHPARKRRRITEPPQSEMTGFLFSGNDGPFYSTYLASFNPLSVSRIFRNPSPYRFPFQLVFRAAAGGFLLGHPPFLPGGPYFVINPVTRDHIRLHRPISPHNLITPMALVAANANTRTIQVVCLVPSQSTGFYRFDAFSVNAIIRTSYDININLGNIDFRSGISCGNAAYFRAMSPPSLVQIGPLPSLHVTTVAIPPEAIPGIPLRDYILQLGTISGRLVLVSSFAAGFRLHVFSPWNRSWARVEVAVAPTEWSSRMVPLRFETSRMEIPFWCLNQNRPVILEGMDVRQLPAECQLPNVVIRMKKRMVPYDGPLPYSVLDCVPHIIFGPTAEMDVVPDSLGVATQQ